MKIDYAEIPEQIRLARASNPSSSRKAGLGAARQSCKAIASVCRAGLSATFHSVPSPLKQGSKNHVIPLKWRA